MSQKLKLYSFYLDYGRMGDLEGLFIAKEEDVKSIIGKEVDFGEVLGKHSWVQAEMEESMFEVIDVPEEVVKILLDKVGEDISGYNPLSYYEEEEE